MTLGFLEGKYQVSSYIGKYLDMYSGGWRIEALPFTFS
jgi:hypothetical protein